MFEEVLQKFCLNVRNVLRFKAAPAWFSLAAGLCYNFENWLVLNGYDKHTRFKYAKKLEDLFHKEYGSDVFPFNKGKEDYINEANGGTIYKNKKRLAFINHWAFANTPPSRSIPFEYAIVILAILFIIGVFFV